MGTFTWPPARTCTWPHTGTFSWPRTRAERSAPRDIHGSPNGAPPRADRLRARLSWGCSAALCGQRQLGWAASLPKHPRRGAGRPGLRLDPPGFAL